MVGLAGEHAKLQRTMNGLSGTASYYRVHGLGSGFPQHLGKFVERRRKGVVRGKKGNFFAQINLVTKH